MGTSYEKSEVMTVEQVAEYLQMSEVWVTKAARDGVLPGFRLGKKWRFRRESVEKYLKSLESGTDGAVDSSTHDETSELRKAS